MVLCKSNADKNLLIGRDRVAQFANMSELAINKNRKKNGEKFVDHEKKN